MSGPAARATDPISTATLPLPGAYKGCRKMAPSQADPTAATFLFPATSDLVLMGGPVVDLTYATTAPDTELNVRVWDVAPDASVQGLVTRGTYRSLDGPGTGLHARFQIAPPTATASRPATRSSSRWPPTTRRTTRPATCRPWSPSTGPSSCSRCSPHRHPHRLRSRGRAATRPRSSADGRARPSHRAAGARPRFLRDVLPISGPDRNPPSITNSEPVQKLLASDDSHTTSSATSSDVPTRPTGEHALEHRPHVKAAEVVGVDHCGVDRARVHRVDADVERAQLEGCRLGEAAQGELARHVARDAGRADECRSPTRC